MIAQGKVDWFNIVIIVVRSTRGISIIILSSIGGISVGEISVGGHVCFGVGGNFQYLFQFINEYKRQDSVYLAYWAEELGL